MKEFRLSHSTETIEIKEDEREKYLSTLGPSLEAEIEQRIAEDLEIGAGKTARVFSSEKIRQPFPVCFKIWRPEVAKLQTRDFVAYRRLQCSSPKEEFNLQDRLYMAGFQRIPRPLAFETVDEHQAMAMEELPGYTLEQIEAAGATIAEPGWKELEQLVLELNRTYKVAHRDLGPQNIFLKTQEGLTKGAALKGEFYLIDLGLSKETVLSPEPEDYTLTIGRNMIRYPDDWQNIENLKPRPAKRGLFAHL
jgi:serine/threonine protein kinase